MIAPPTASEIEGLLRDGRGAEAYARALALLVTDANGGGTKATRTVDLLLFAAATTERQDEAAAVLREHRDGIDPVAYARVQASLALLSGNVAEARAQAESLTAVPNAAIARIGILIAVAERMGTPDVGLTLMRERERMVAEYPLAWMIERWGVQRLLGRGGDVAREAAAVEARIPPTHPAERRAVRLNRAMALLGAGRFEQTVEIAVETVAEMMDAGTCPATRTVTIRIGTRARQHMVAADIERLVITRGLPVVLVAGSLLWLMRDGDFHAHDTDMDLAVIPPATSAEVIAALIATGSFRPQRRDVDYGAFRALTHVETGLAVDVLEYRLEDGMFVSTWRHPIGAILRRSAVPPFTIRPTFHEGVRRLLPFPDAPESLLTATYGDWRCPDPTFDSVVSSPAILEFTDFLAAIAAIRLLDAMTSGASGKAAHLARRLRDHGVAPNVMKRVIDATGGDTVTGAGPRPCG